MIKRAETGGLFMGTLLWGEKALVDEMGGRFCDILVIGYWRWRGD